MLFPERPPEASIARLCADWFRTEIQSTLDKFLTETESR
jgi:hypothetical protein